MKSHSDTTTPDQGDERRAFQRWEAYAKRAGFLDSNGNAYYGQQKEAQTSWFTWQACEKERDAAQPVALEASEGAEDEWRRLALQFDGHRMQAMGLIRYAITRIAKNGVYEDLRAKLVEFNAAPPLSGEAILVERIAALAAPMPQPEPTSKGEA